GDTLFEIGSITKVFTALLLADAVQRGEVALSDPVSKYLPANVKVPERGGKKITLQDLAMHVSGLPRLPTNITPKEKLNPYADYTITQLYQFLGRIELTRDIGATYDYSNVGAGLLGHILTLRAGTDYETLVRTRIAAPLAMKSTAIKLSDSLQKRLAAGHNSQRERVPNWDMPAVAGAGALRSTANDLLNFLAANLHQTTSPLTPAITSMLAVRHNTPIPNTEIALGWHVTSTPGSEMVWHNGGTGGYRSFLGFDPKKRIGVVVLANMLTDEGIDDIGRHLLDPAIPLLQAPPAAPKQRTAIAVDPVLFDRYAGRYELAPGIIITITREGDRLFAEATGQSKVELFAETERDFFVREVDAQLTFVSDFTGHATKLILHQNGHDQEAQRTEALK
ncbi:MAG: serine hydrolase, partial [Thermoanaerobaculia bacterium]